MVAPFDYQMCTAELSENIGFLASWIVEFIFQASVE